MWFVGRPAAGKSTVAARVAERLRRETTAPVDNLDGDGLRERLHPDLGFTESDRRTNNRRTAEVCRLLVKNGVVTVAAQIAPFADARATAREIVREAGELVVVHVACPLAVARERDPKGLYERAEAGEIPNFTGVSHPFERPTDPDLRVETDSQTPVESTDAVLSHLDDRGFVDTVGDDPELTAAERAAARERLAELEVDLP